MPMRNYESPRIRHASRNPKRPRHGRYRAGMRGESAWRDEQTIQAGVVEPAHATEPDRKCGKCFMVSLSNHEASHYCPCEAFMVRQAHHEGNKSGAHFSQALRPGRAARHPMFDKLAQGSMDTRIGMVVSMPRLVTRPDDVLTTNVPSSSSFPKLRFANQPGGRRCPIARSGRASVKSLSAGRAGSGCRSCSEPFVPAPMNFSLLNVLIARTSNVLPTHRAAGVAGSAFG